LAAVIIGCIGRLIATMPGRGSGSLGRATGTPTQQAQSGLLRNGK